MLGTKFGSSARAASEEQVSLTPESAPWLHLAVWLVCPAAEVLGFSFLLPQPQGYWHVWPCLAFMYTTNIGYSFSCSPTFFFEMVSLTAPEAVQRLSNWLGSKPYRTSCFCLPVCVPTSTLMLRIHMQDCLLVQHFILCAISPGLGLHILLAT